MGYVDYRNGIGQYPFKISPWSNKSPPFDYLGFVRFFSTIKHCLPRMVHTVISSTSFDWHFVQYLCLLAFRFFHAGILDTASGHTHIDSGLLYVHVRSEVSGHTSSGHRRLDAADKMGPEARCGHVRVPDINPARSQLFCTSKCCRWVRMRVRAWVGVGEDNCPLPQSDYACVGGRA